MCISFLQPLRHVVIAVVHEEDDHDDYDETRFIHHHKYKDKEYKIVTFLKRGNTTKKITFKMIKKIMKWWSWCNNLNFRREKSEMYSIECKWLLFFTFMMGLWCDDNTEWFFNKVWTVGCVFRLKIDLVFGKWVPCACVMSRFVGWRVYWILNYDETWSSLDWSCNNNR